MSKSLDKNKFAHYNIYKSAYLHEESKKEMDGEKEKLVRDYVKSLLEYNQKRGKAINYNRGIDEAAKVALMDDELRARRKMTKLQNALIEAFSDK